MPLHPMIVHFPIVLAFIMPVAIIATMAFVKQDQARKKAWLTILSIQILFSALSFGATALGEVDEEVVERVVSERLIEDHAELGEMFAWSTLPTLAICAVSYYSKANMALAALTLVLSLFSTSLSVATGHAGAELVYRHNAASAFVQGGGAQSGGISGLLLGGGGDDDDD